MSSLSSPVRRLHRGVDWINGNHDNHDSTVQPCSSSPVVSHISETGEVCVSLVVTPCTLSSFSDVWVHTFVKPSGELMSMAVSLLFLPRASGLESEYRTWEPLLCVCATRRITWCEDNIYNTEYKNKNDSAPQCEVQSLVLPPFPSESGIWCGTRGKKPSVGWRLGIPVFAGECKGCGVLQRVGPAHVGLWRCVSKQFWQSHHGSKQSTLHLFCQ